MLKPGGTLVVSVPTLAHLESRVQFLLRGRLIRTASELKQVTAFFLRPGYLARHMGDVARLAV